MLTSDAGSAHHHSGTFLCLRFCGPSCADSLLHLPASGRICNARLSFTSLMGTQVCLVNAASTEPVQR